MSGDLRAVPDVPDVDVPDEIKVVFTALVAALEAQQRMIVELRAAVANVDERVAGIEGL